MSRYFAVLGKTPPVGAGDPPGVQPAARPSEYSELIQQLFQGSSVVAIIGAGLGKGVTSICEGIASELSHLGYRVVLVSVDTLLQANPLALFDERVVLPRVGRHVWLWPVPAGSQDGFFKSRAPVVGHWLDSLRKDFDSVLLDCPSLETGPGGAAVAGLAEAALLAVDAAHTPKHQILLDQRRLQLIGVKLAGCILIDTK